MSIRKVLSAKSQERRSQERRVLWTRSGFVQNPSEFCGIDTLRVAPLLSMLWPRFRKRNPSSFMKKCPKENFYKFSKYSDTIAPKKRCFWRRKSCRFYACFSLKTAIIEVFALLTKGPIRGPKPQKRAKNQRETYKSSGEPRQICYCLVKPAGFLTSEKRHFLSAFSSIKTPLKGVFGVWRSYSCNCGSAQARNTVGIFAKVVQPTKCEFRKIRKDFEQSHS
jgi:hypothetical protein